MSRQDDKTPQPSEKPGNLSGGEEHAYGPTPAGPKTGAQAQSPTGRVIDETK